MKYNCVRSEIICFVLQNLSASNYLLLGVTSYSSPDIRICACTCGFYVFKIAFMLWLWWKFKLCIWNNLNDQSIHIGCAHKILVLKTKELLYKSYLYLILFMLAWLCSCSNITEYSALYGCDNWDNPFIMKTKLILLW